MWDDGCMGRRVVVAVRQSDSDRHADGLRGSSYRRSDCDGWSDGLDGLSYRRSGGDGWSDGLLYMVEGWTDDVGHSDRRGKMVYRRSDGDGWSDRWIVGLTGGVTDCCVMDKLTGWWMDGSCDGQMGMTDGLVVVRMDSVTD